MLGVVDVFDPLAMLVCGVGRQAQRLHIACRKVACALGRAAHFGSADRRAIGRKAEKEHTPGAAPFMKADRYVLAVGGAVERTTTNGASNDSFILCYHNIIILRS